METEDERAGDNRVIMGTGGLMGGRDRLFWSGVEDLDRGSSVKEDWKASD
jgi:hypothetical protein